MRGTNSFKTRFTKDDVVPARTSSAIGALIDKVDDLSRKSSSQQLIAASPTTIRPYPASISMVVSEKVNTLLGEWPLSTLLRGSRMIDKGV